MSQWKSADEVLDFAIEREEEAATFYKDLAKGATSPSIREVFEEFAREEALHKAKLLGIKRSGNLGPASERILDLKIGDYLVEARARPDMSYQEALILAMKREKAAFKLYMDLAVATSDGELRELLRSLAQEEAKHKLRFEVEYDEHVLSEN